jgi:hypothetical protein
MSAGVAPDPAAQQQQLEAALLADTDAAGQPADHLDSDDDFQYEEVEVPRYAQAASRESGFLLQHTHWDSQSTCAVTHDAQWGGGRG